MISRMYNIEHVAKFYFPNIEIVYSLILLIETQLN